MLVVQLKDLEGYGAQVSNGVLRLHPRRIQHTERTHLRLEISGVRRTRSGLVSTPFTAQATQRLRDDFPCSNLYFQEG